MPKFSGSHLTCIRGERTVFAGLDFSVDGGEALYLLGPNGAGKSSLLRLMAGLLRPAAGELVWDRDAISDDLAGHRRRVHYVGHHDAIKGVLTVEENLAFWAAIEGSRPTAAMDALTRFGLGALAASPARFLSAGQRRRLNLARLVTSPAPVWLLDEPATALDQESAAVLQRVISAHQASGGLVVIASHDEPVADARTLNLQAGGTPS